MPALYAHNKFGKLVIPRLSVTAKNTIKKYPDYFRIGLQGPDFLFFNIFNSKITQLGKDIHHHDSYSFMKQSAKVINHCGICSPQYAYIMGFICHYTLDNACHPLIHQFMNSTDCGHVEIEGDMENLILTLDGISPASYPMYKLVPTGKAIAHCMKDFFPELSCREIANSLEMMNIIKRMFVAPGCIKRHVLESIMRLSLHYKKLKGHLIYPYANIKCRKETELLYNTLINSVPDAVYLINNFTNYALSGTMLTDKFHRDFNNRYFV